MLNEVLCLFYYSKIANADHHSYVFSVVHNSIQKITNISIMKPIILISILNKYLNILKHLDNRTPLTYVCSYVCMYVCTYVCTYIRMYVCMYIRMYVHTYVCMYVCMYMCVCMYVCMYACMYAGRHVHMYPFYRKTMD